MIHRWPAAALGWLGVACILVAGTTRLEAGGGRSIEFTADYPDGVIAGDVLRLTLPNGKTVVGKVDEVARDGASITKAAGKLTHPGSGGFMLARQGGEAGTSELAGSLQLDGDPTVWKIQPVGDRGAWRWVECPAEDAFRPRQMQMPVARPAGMPAPEVTRANAEETLRKDVVIEPLANGNVRVGTVEVVKMTREARIPATVNMTDGTVEYALVTHTGKCHESLFSTIATPRDIHLAMLLLGLKPAAMSDRPDHALVVPDGSAVLARAEWDDAGKRVSHPLAELVLVMPVPSPEARQASLLAPWLYNGSRFTKGGFAASIEGSIIALMADEMALINNPSADRKDDESHVPNPNLLPKPGTPVTIVLAAPAPKVPQVVPSPAKP